MTWLQRVHAACLAGPAVASHRTAAALLGVPGFARGLVEVTAMRHRRRKPGDVVWHEALHLAPVDVEVRAGIPTTTPARTFVDLATLLDDEGLLAVHDHLTRAGLTTSGRLRSVVDRLGRRRHGAARVRRVLDLRLAGGATPESPLETELDALLRRFGLPAPQRQHVVTDGGRFVARVDFAYPEARLALEADGDRWHRGVAEQGRDRRRDAALERLGWLVLHFTTWDIRSRPEWVAAEVDTRLRSRTETTADGWPRRPAQMHALPRDAQFD